MANSELPKLTMYQYDMIQKFKMPKSYVIFYKFYKYFFKYALFFGLLSCFPIAFMDKIIPSFTIIEIIGASLAVPSVIYMPIYFYALYYKRWYAKQIGLSINEFNMWMVGRTVD